MPEKFEGEKKEGKDLEPKQLYIITGEHGGDYDPMSDVQSLSGSVYLVSNPEKRGGWALAFDDPGEAEFVRKEIIKKHDKDEVGEVSEVKPRKCVPENSINWGNKQDRWKREISVKIIEDRKEGCPS